MTPRTSRRAAAPTPEGTAAPRGSSSLELRTPAGAGTPTAAPAGPDVPQAAVSGEGRERPAGSTEALSGEAFRKAMKAAQSAKAKTQRQQRARPWQGRDPYRKAVPGGKRGSDRAS
jgi:hypothetical protein